MMLGFLPMLFLLLFVISDYVRFGSSVDPFLKIEKFVLFSTVDLYLNIEKYVLPISSVDLLKNIENYAFCIVPLNASFYTLSNF